MDERSMMHEQFLAALDQMESEARTLDEAHLTRLLRGLYLAGADHPAVIEWLNRWVGGVLERLDAK